VSSHLRLTQLFNRTVMQAILIDEKISVKK
jgi:hypothetical protein